MELPYTTLFYPIQPLMWPRLLLRNRKAPAYRKRWAERYGFCQNKVEPDGILPHSVPVGETLATIPLARALCHRYPSMPIIVTTMTPIGSERAMSAFGKDIYHVYLPYDLPSAMNRFLSTIQPKLVIVMETELWLNMVAVLHRRKILLVIANVRLSECSAKGYTKLGGFMCHLSSRTTLVAARNGEDDNRFFALGLKRNQLAVTEGLKFDISVIPELAARVTTPRRQWAPYREIWTATSTHDGEEQIVLQTRKKLLETFPNLLLTLVPRHPERFPNARETVQEAGMSFTLRSTGEIPSSSTQVAIGDTTDELMLLYGIADLAFADGSLVECGGHNPPEPMVHAILVPMGPYAFNFKDICARLQQDDGLITVTDVDLSVREVSTLLTDEDYRLWYGRHAVEVLHQSQGALSRLLKLLQSYIPQRSH